jgi:hypothetical protein
MRSSVGRVDRLDRGKVPYLSSKTKALHIFGKHTSSFLDTYGVTKL